MVRSLWCVPGVLFVATALGSAFSCSGGTFSSDGGNAGTMTAGEAGAGADDPTGMGGASGSAGGGEGGKDDGGTGSGGSPIEAGAPGTSGRGGDAGGGGADGGDGGGGPVTGCPRGLPGPKLVEVRWPAGGAVASYCIDATEVTNADYAEFLTAHTPTGVRGRCTWNTTHTPSNGWPATGRGNYPVVYVDFCDALDYCAWAGKRLCGGMGGAPLGSGSSPEWTYACSNATMKVYPYGDTYDPSACVTSDSDGTPDYQASDEAQPVGTATCEGGVPGLFDMTGNVLEWVASCDPYTNYPIDNCSQMGGSFTTGNVACTQIVGGSNSDIVTNYVGFRCCADAL